MTAVLEQLSLLDDVEPYFTKRVPGVGVVLESLLGCWQARYSGRWGWLIHRYTQGIGWESWEPDLPHGVEALTSKADAVVYLLGLVDQYGDTPQAL